MKLLFLFFDLYKNGALLKVCREENFNGSFIALFSRPAAKKKSEREKEKLEKKFRLII